MKKIFSIIAVIFISTFVHSQEIKKIKIVELEKTIKESKTPLIVNFWATFCKPCLEEMPYFQALAKKNNVTLILVSLDLEKSYPAKIKSYIVKNKYTSPVFWLDEYNADYFCPKVDSSWSGAIPASLFLNNSTGYRKFFEDQLSKEKLEKEIMAILPKQN